MQQQAWNKQLFLQQHRNKKQIFREPVEWKEEIKWGKDAFDLSDTSDAFFLWQDSTEFLQLLRLYYILLMKRK